MSEPKLQTLQINGIRMRVAEQGSGPLVLFCHGWPESWYSWRHQLAALAAAGYRAVAPDMRGYGGTDAPPAIEQYTMLHLVGDMVDLVKALGEQQAVIVGHDWGAPVAWTSALLRPDLFRAVAGMSVPFTPPGKIDLLSRSGSAGRAHLLHAVLPDARRGRSRAGARRGSVAAAHLFQRFGRRARARDVRRARARRGRVEQHRRSGHAAGLAAARRHRLLRGRIQARRFSRRAELVPQSAGARGNCWRPGAAA